MQAVEQFEAIKQKEKEQVEELEAARAEARAATGACLSPIGCQAVRLLTAGQEILMGRLHLRTVLTECWLDYQQAAT